MWHFSTNELRSLDGDDDECVIVDVMKNVFVRLPLRNRWERSKLCYFSSISMTDLVGVVRFHLLHCRLPTDLDVAFSTPLVVERCEMWESASMDAFVFLENCESCWSPLGSHRYVRDCFFAEFIGRNAQLALSENKAIGFYWAKREREREEKRRTSGCKIIWMDRFQRNNDPPYKQRSLVSLISQPKRINVPLLVRVGSVEWPHFSSER